MDNHPQVVRSLGPDRMTLSSLVSSGRSRAENAESSEGLVVGLPAGSPTNMVTVVDSLSWESNFDPSNFVVTAMGSGDVISSEGPKALESGETFSTPMAPLANKFKKRRRATPSSKES